MFFFLYSIIMTISEVMGSILGPDRVGCEKNTYSGSGALPGLMLELELLKII